MKFLPNALAAALVSLATTLTAAEEPSAWDKVKTLTHEKKTEVVAEGQKMIAATDRKIDELKKEASRSTGEVRKAHEQNMKELQAKRKAAKAELDKMERSAAHAWDATKEGFHHAYQAMNQAYEKAKAGPGQK